MTDKERIELRKHLALVALEDHSVVDAEFEEVEDSFRDDNDAA